MIMHRGCMIAVTTGDSQRYAWRGGGRRRSPRQHPGCTADSGHVPRSSPNRGGDRATPAVERDRCRSVGCRASDTPRSPGPSPWPPGAPVPGMPA